MRKLLVPILMVVVIGGAGLFVWKTKQIDLDDAPKTQETTKSEAVKEFTMTAYYDPALKKPIFSVPEMAVRKGDRVKIKVTNTMGMHDFVIDELGVATELPLNQEVTVEFVADKAGDFVYYCSKPGHRQAGQWGTLKVSE